MCFFGVVSGSVVAVFDGALARVFGEDIFLVFFIGDVCVMILCWNIFLFKFFILVFLLVVGGGFVVVVEFVVGGVVVVEFVARLFLVYFGFDC